LRANLPHIRAALAALALLLAAAGAARPAADPLARLAAAATKEARSAAAAALIAELPPAQLERRLPEASSPGSAPPALAALAATLGEAGPDLLPRLTDYLGAAAAARARRLAAVSAGEGAGAAADWTDREIAELLRLALLDPSRFGDDPAFRERALGVLERALERSSPVALRDRLLDALGGLPGFDFAAGERVSWAWGALPRRASERRIDAAHLGAESGQGRARTERNCLSPKGEFEHRPQADPARIQHPRLRFDADDGGDGRPLAASVYSLPGTFFDAQAVTPFLSAVRALDRERRIVVLTDLALARPLGDRAHALGVDLLLNHGRPYSPWPRDPFSLTHEEGGKERVVVLVRPNLQPGREEDANLGPELVQDLPQDLDAAWGEPRWSRAPVPFHNGQVLLTARAAWITLHTLEPRILELLGERRVPVESFASGAGIDRYLQAARSAAAELAALYGRPIRFVHPLPEGNASAPLPARSALLHTLGGGAGYDLDSLVTLLPGIGGRGRNPPHALVADLAAGRALLGRLGAADWQGLATGYGLTLAGGLLGTAMLSAQGAPRPAALAPFLDLVAAHLKSQGFAVERLPLLFVPVPLLAAPAGLTHPDFLLTWNNVVVERRRGALRAEGFSSLLPAGDALAREAFARAGAHLDLLPPLVRSVVLNGGYRCTSNHLRRGA
jgi:hypothetical protein